MRKSLHTKGQRAFCRVIIAARQNAGLTQMQLADRLRKPQSFVAKIEAGERRVDVIEFLIISESLGQDSTTLLNQIKDELG